MTRIRFTPHAVATLNEIAQWTYTHFGAAQAERYRVDLIQGCDRLENPSPSERSCAGLVSSASGELFYVRAGMHFIVFRRREGEVAILDFLHVRSDLASRLVSFSDS
ncbi:MAG: type II toxin-antitoxin system RelE/ParE family toxin [Oceanicaulis sp.]|uniref:type II toxin-antitoxin system RelE/ParE family toxin n=1 Tax=Glycocaulis sp. TaxID=1969725 RepID=UPI0025BE5F24|nr:type II toxin-antitoxin system RelE/ParE family toxin [Glycocaulis sp.]MCC5980144.1 type II toxin-antitoxin system RelE/ParE family toxin [Oceanicaulis sp.]MCH8522496.1 type II toxin-antitoxin system RelE/ParE family toxin [Glycocaulis sp.]